MALGFVAFLVKLIFESEISLLLENLGNYPLKNLLLKFQTKVFSYLFVKSIDSNIEPL